LVKKPKLYRKQNSHSLSLANIHGTVCAEGPNITIETDIPLYTQHIYWRH